MDDHAPAPEARTKCDRTFGDMQFVHNKNLWDVKEVYNEICTYVKVGN